MPRPRERFGGSIFQDGPPDLAAVRFHERRAAAMAGAQRMDAIETQLPEISVARRKRKARAAAAPATNGVAVG
jgi:hypothetical protein